MKKTSVLRDILASSGAVPAPGCFDGVSARLVEAAGFKTAYLTGYGMAASMLGQPDVGLVGMSEVVTHARNIANAISIPAICDADTGYGGILNVRRTVRELESAGVAGIHIEDQVMPKKCGALGDRAVVSAREMVARITAAREAALDPDFVLIARTDSKSCLGIDEANRRLKEYLRAGADLVMLVDSYTIEEIRRVADGVEGRLVISAGRPELQHDLSAEEYGGLGVKVILYPLTVLYAAIGAMQAILGKLHADRKLTSQYLRENLPSLAKVNEMLSLLDLLEIEKQHTGKDVHNA